MGKISLWDIIQRDFVPPAIEEVIRHLKDNYKNFNYNEMEVDSSYVNKRCDTAEVHLKVRFKTSNCPIKDTNNSYYLLVKAVVLVNGDKDNEIVQLVAERDRERCKNCSLQC